MTMIKMMSAALLAVSMLAAPAMATEKAAQTAPFARPAIAAKAHIQPQAQVLIKTAKMRNANARMGHHRHHRQIHRHFHKRIGGHAIHPMSKLGIRHGAPSAHRG